ncbi:MAG: chromosomal replication initiator protein DnaA [Treponemataceae bacterium]|nr:chromosomal replication initiator protein DnaA [Treponemataceae bacterium]
MSDFKVFWEEAVKVLYSEYENLNRTEEFNLWIKAIDYVNSHDTTIVISVPSTFFKEQLIRRGDISKLQNFICELSGQNISFEFEIKPKELKSSDNTPNNTSFTKNNSVNVNTKTNDNSDTPNLTSKKTDKQHPQLSERYSFENFVYGDNSVFAYNATLAVAKNPGKAYNPVLLYGGVGLGKTHLMQAIGNYAWKESNAKIIYITAENFTNEFIKALGQGQVAISKFKDKYRSVDILLIDDIHFLQKKDGTQEELFHTFNALYDSNKQIVFTCDRPVSELKNLSDRLRSRFERGLNVDLQPPDYETRRAIIEKKLEESNKTIPSDIIDFIAHNIASNVRDLEAAIMKIVAYNELINKKEITIETASQLLRDFISSPKQSNLGIDTIIKVIAEEYGLSSSDIKGKKRTKNIIMPRQIAMYIAREITEFSTTEIGAEFGRDHTTVVHSCQKIEESIQSDSKFDSKIQLLIRNIKDYKKSI